MKKTFSFLVVLTLLLSGCPSKKSVDERFDKMEARLAKIEKVIAPEEETQKEAYNVPGGNSPYLGTKDAKVSIVVFSNFQCPYCAKADASLRKLVDDPELKGKVAIYFKNFPFDRHENARSAAKAALAAGLQGNEKFWAMSDKMFQNQDKLSDANYKKWAGEIGLDVAKFSADLKAKDKEFDDLINADMKLGVENAKLQGTPWILVSGWLLDGPIDPDTIKKMIKEKNL